MTKKKNKRFVVRAQRRVLNRALDFFKRASGRRLNISGWGGGIARSEVKER